MKVCVLNSRQYLAEKVMKGISDNLNHEVFLLNSWEPRWRPGFQTCKPCGFPIVEFRDVEQRLDWDFFESFLQGEMRKKTPIELVKFFKEFYFYCKYFEEYLKSGDFAIVTTTDAFIHSQIALAAGGIMIQPALLNFEYPTSINMRSAILSLLHPSLSFVSRPYGFNKPNSKLFVWGSFFKNYFMNKSRQVEICGPITKYTLGGVKNKKNILILAPEIYVSNDKVIEQYLELISKLNPHFNVQIKIHPNETSSKCWEKWKHLITQGGGFQTHLEWASIVISYYSFGSMEATLSGRKGMILADTVDYRANYFGSNYPIFDTVEAAITEIEQENIKTTDLLAQYFNNGDLDLEALERGLLDQQGRC